MAIEPYINLPRNVAMLVSLRMATLKELQTFYSVQDMYCMLDVAVVDAYNKRKNQPKE